MGAQIEDHRLYGKDKAVGESLTLIQKSEIGTEIRVNWLYSRNGVVRASLIFLQKKYNKY